MEGAHYDIVGFFVASTLLILIMAGFIVSIVYLYRKRQSAYFKALEVLKLEYEKNLLGTQLEIQEQTLLHISREIHDNISLSLTLAKLNLNTLDLTNPNKIGAQVESSLNQISKAIEDLSNISKGLNTELITSQGLLQVLDVEVKRLRELQLFKLDFQIVGNPVFLDSQKELVIFRIIQEAFNNVIKHAKANSVTLILDYHLNHITVSISDDGKGFSLTERELHGLKGFSAGLSNMQKRASLFNGNTLIDSKPGSGTQILITIPY